MSNRERAADLITTWQARHKTEMDNNTDWAAQNLAGDLADAGLLAPDLPEPRIDIDGWQEWGHKHGNHVALENGKITVCISDDISRDLTREEAQDLAAWIHAAADHVEAQHG